MLPNASINGIEDTIILSLAFTGCFGANGYTECFGVFHVNAELLGNFWNASSFRTVRVKRDVALSWPLTVPFSASHAGDREEPEHGRGQRPPARPTSSSNFDQHSNRHKPLSSHGPTLRGRRSQHSRRGRSLHPDGAGTGTPNPEARRSGPLLRRPCGLFVPDGRLTGASAATASTTGAFHALSTGHLEATKGFTTAATDGGSRELRSEASCRQHRLLQPQLVIFGRRRDVVQGTAAQGHEARFRRGLPEVGDGASYSVFWDRCFSGGTERATFQSSKRPGGYGWVSGSGGSVARDCTSRAIVTAKTDRASAAPRVAATRRV